MGLQLPVLNTPQAIDPVCGMKVDPQKAPANAQWNGKNYYFCNPGCQDRFLAEPLQYVDDNGVKLPPRPAAAAPTGTIYTCPMDPEIRQTHPGACPKCGMALEPENAATAPPEADNPCRRFRVR